MWPALKWLVTRVVGNSGVSIPVAPLIFVPLLVVWMFDYATGYPLEWLVRIHDDS